MNPTPPNSESSTDSTELSSNAVWNCELKALTESTTVGALKDLICRGDYVADLDRNKLKIEFEDKQNQYALQIIEVKTVEGQSLSLVVAPYKAGKFEKPVFVITDGLRSVKVNDLTWSVESVLQGKEDKPIPSMGPFSLSMPWWFWSSILGLIVLVFILIGLKLKKTWDRKKLIDELSSRGTALSPFNQFNKDFRLQLKEWQQKELTEKVKAEQEWRLELLKNTEKNLREYLMRELLIPTLEWTDIQILTEIKRSHLMIHNELSSEIKKILREIKQIQKGKSTITSIDCEQLTSMVRDLVEKINEIRLRKKS